MICILFLTAFINLRMLVNLLETFIYPKFFFSCSQYSRILLSAAQMLVVAYTSLIPRPIPTFQCCTLSVCSWDGPGYEALAYTSESVYSLHSFYTCAHHPLDLPYAIHQYLLNRLSLVFKLIHLYITLFCILTNYPYYSKLRNIIILKNDLRLNRHQV